MSTFKKFLLSSLPLLVASSCAVDSEPTQDNSCRGGKCDNLDLPDSEIEPSPCDGLIVDASGRSNQRIAGRLGDPLAEFALKPGEDCPLTFQDIMAKLRINDNENCTDERDGIKTRVVSETAQPSETPTSYRLVVSRRCGGRETHELLFSLFGIQFEGNPDFEDEDAPAPKVRDFRAAEIIAFDKSEGVFNYYETDGREMTFFGNSRDMLKGAEGNVRRCASCHDGGGLVMKELHTPWLHWEGHADIVGAQELVDASPDFGTKATGAEFEGVVKAGNRAWNKSRLDFVKQNAPVKEILKPLFCTVEVNLDNGSGFSSPIEGGEGGDEMDRIPFDSLLDPEFKSFGGIDIEFADYDAQIKANGQRVQGIPGAPDAVDTLFDYAFIERSEIDKHYVETLEEEGIVDSEFIKDALLVDFTRPIFSEDRCDLLDFAPTLSSDDLTPEKIRQGFLDNLALVEAGTPEAEFKNNLLTEGGHDDTVTVFTDACESLESAEIVERALRITSMNRDIARNLHVFEFPATMPVDNLSSPQGTRFHPEDCSLTSEFVAVTPTVVPEEPEPEEPEPEEPEPEEPEPEEPSAPDCAHDLCEEGEKLDPQCADSCVADICEEDPFCCNNEWDNLCVDQVSSVCGRDTCE